MNGGKAARWATIEGFGRREISDALRNLLPVSRRVNSALKKQRDSAYLFNRKDARRGRASQ